MRNYKPAVIIQGMRRSSTTFLFDCLCADDNMYGLYEPLAKAKKSAVGGGSRIRTVDFFHRIRQLRQQIASEEGWTDKEVLRNCNYGAPSNPELEFSTKLSKPTQMYLTFLASSAHEKTPLFKFTRAWSKTTELKEAFPNAVFLHIIRDPRAVVSSFLLGKSQINRTRIGSDEIFFRQSEMGTGNKRFAQGLCQYLGDSWSNEPDYVQLLKLWAITNENTHRAHSIFGDRYLMIRHEDFITDPEPILQRIYSLIGADVPPAVSTWTRKNLKAQKICVAPNSTHWQKALEKIGNPKLLEEFSYLDSGYEAFVWN